MSTEQKLNEAQQRVLQLLSLLANDVVDGLAPSQMATALDVPASYITRDLANLAAQQFVVKIDKTGHWILGSAAAAMAVRAAKSIGQADSRLAEIKHRFS
jgi:DNA-binding IclR family transcriptional regulator